MSNNNSQLCLQCGNGKLYKTVVTKKGETSDNPDIDMTIIAYQQYPCDRCGFTEGRAIAAFTDKRGILVPKNENVIKGNIISKGNAKKIRSTSKPRRQEPR